MSIYQVWSDGIGQGVFTQIFKVVAIFKSFLAVLCPNYLGSGREKNYLTESDTIGSAATGTTSYHRLIQKCQKLVSIKSIKSIQNPKGCSWERFHTLATRFSASPWFARARGVQDPTAPQTPQSLDCLDVDCPRYAGELNGSVLKNRFTKMRIMVFIPALHTANCPFMCR